MKKKVVFIVIYVLLCLVPLATIPFSKDTSAAEKRTLSAFPKAVNEGKPNLSFFTEFDAWFSDHMGGRSYLVEAQTMMKEYVFRESAESSVILGSNGWLFYEKTAQDFSKVATLTERNTRNIAVTLRMMQDYCTERDVDFVFTVAPNKNTLYPDNMPAWYVVTSGKSNLDMLTADLDRFGVNYADLRAAFAREQKVLYQARDSHWTYEGGMLAYRVIVNKMKKQHNLYDGVTFTERADWDADLANMLYPNAPDNDVQAYPDLEYSFEVKGFFGGDEDLVIETTGGAGEGSLLMFRDSFGNTTWRYFADAFADADFERAVPYRLNTIDRVDIDTVVLEIVERNIGNLAEKAPMMEAPKRTVEVLDAYDISDLNNRIESRETGVFLHLYGSVDPGVLGENYHVYIIVKNNGITEFYEAFPIFERELLGEERCCDNGFSCYLPEEVKGAESIGILTESNGRLFYMPFTK
ncbi:MAG: hypothetical protein J5643_10935 [Lachnospiraceae bacterium]|nr:hypothetical protein [Lachnospiraceae bacterium]